MPIKRSKKLWHYEWLSSSEEEKEMDWIINNAITTMEKLFDVLFKWNPTKWAVEEIMKRNEIRSYKDKSRWIDDLRSRIARLFGWMEDDY